MTIVVNSVIVLDVKLLRERLNSNSKTRMNEFNAECAIFAVSQSKQNKRWLYPEMHI